MTRSVFDFFKDLAWVWISFNDIQTHANRRLYKLRCTLSCGTLLLFVQNYYHKEHTILTRQAALLA